MPFPDNWPSTTGSGRKSERIYADGIATNDFADNAFAFVDLVYPEGSCPKKVDVYPITALRVFNDGTADLYVTFDGTTIHGIVRPSEKLLYENRAETAIAVRTDPTHPHDLFAAFRIEGW